MTVYWRFLGSLTRGALLWEGTKTFRTLAQNGNTKKASEGLSIQILEKITTKTLIALVFAKVYFKTKKKK